MIKKIFFFAFLFCLINCSKKKEYLFIASAKDSYNQNHILLVGTMFFNSNNSIQKNDSILNHLKKTEIYDAKESTYLVDNEIYKSDYYSAYIFSKIDSDLSSGYILVTFDNDFNLIDSIEIANINNDENVLCVGAITKNLIITKTCRSTNTTITKKINTKGEIITFNL